MSNNTKFGIMFKTQKIWFIFLLVIVNFNHSKNNYFEPIHKKNHINLLIIFNMHTI